MNVLLEALMFLGIALAGVELALLRRRLDTLAAMLKVHEAASKHRGEILAGLLGRRR